MARFLVAPRLAATSPRSCHVQPPTVTPLGPQGIFHYDCGHAASRGSVRHFDPASRHDRLVAPLDADFIAGLSLTPDGKTLAYGRGEATSNLMMIENFR